MTRAEAFNRIQELNRSSEKALAAHDTIQQFLKENEFSSSDFTYHAKETAKDLVLIAREKQNEATKLTMDNYGSND